MTDRERDPPSDAAAALAHTHQRLEHIYEISQLFARFENVDETFDKALAVAAKTLRLRSAILIEAEEGRTKMILWPSERESTEEMQAARVHIQDAYAYLVGAGYVAPLDWHEQSGATALPEREQIEAQSVNDKRFIVIPLVVRGRPVFGALQLEGAEPLDKSDLFFVNSLANQLAVAIDRDMGWRREIQRRKEAEELKRRYEALIDNLDHAFVWEVDAKTHRILYVSARIEKLLGYPRLQLPERTESWIALVHPDDRQAVKGAFERALVGERDQRVDHRAVDTNGRVRWFQTRIHLASPDTAQPRLQGISFDVTQSKETEEAQRFLLEAGRALGSSLNYQTAFASLARLAVPRLGDFCFIDVLTTSDEMQRVAWAWVNPETGKESEEILRSAPSLGATVFRTGASELRPDVDEAWLRAAMHSERHFQFFRGQKVRSAMTVPLRLGQRNVGTLSFLSTDSGRRHTEADLALAEELALRAAFSFENGRLYDQAKEAVGMREHILAIVAHDLRSPLSAILLSAGLLTRRGEDADRRVGQQRSAAAIMRAAQRMQRLIEDLLDFSSIEAGRLAIKPRLLDPASLVREAVAAFDVIAQQQLQLTADCAAGLPPINCDHDRILQVLSNLVGNAVKVVPPGGRITLRAEARGLEVVFSVADTGPGISERDLRHLFERYWRSNEVTYKGTGLGLAIARGIVVAHGGRLWAESTLDRGATFFFTLPALAPPVRPR